MELWQIETSKYYERIDKLSNWKSHLPQLDNRFPEIPMNYTPSKQAGVCIQICLYALDFARVADETLLAFTILFRKGIFTNITLSVRFIYELWGAIHYAKKIVLDANNPTDVDSSMRTTIRLLQGARSEVSLPWGGYTNQKSINVLEFIRSLSAINSEAENNYEFLCESCHPSNIRLTTWALAGSFIQNWGNEKFKIEAHKLIAHTLSILELSLTGISIDMKAIFDIALPIIETDKLKNTN